MAQNSCVVLVLDASGASLAIPMRNLGWSAEDAGYVSEFDLDGETHRSVFMTTKHIEQHCAAPELRLAHDEDFLFEELGLFVQDVIDPS